MIAKDHKNMKFWLVVDPAPAKNYSALGRSTQEWCQRIFTMIRLTLGGFGIWILRARANLTAWRRSEGIQGIWQPSEVEACWRNSPWYTNIAMASLYRWFSKAYHYEKRICNCHLWLPETRGYVIWTPLLTQRSSGTSQRDSKIKISLVHHHLLWCWTMPMRFNLLK